MLALHLTLATTGFFSWFIFDRTRVGLAVGLMTAVGGTLIEIGLISQLHLYQYPAADLLGAVDSWIPWVYFAGAPAVGNLARGYARGNDGE